VSLRHCFLLRVHPERMDEYRRRHQAVWPEMLEALAEAGWRNYSLFLADDGLLVGYVEADDLEASLAAMARTDVNARWQARRSSISRTSSTEFVDRKRNAFENKKARGYLLPLH
jgi:L-rhamnose mutarotase